MLMWGSIDLLFLVGLIIAENISLRQKSSKEKNPHVMRLKSPEVEYLCTACV